MNSNIASASIQSEKFAYHFYRIKKCTDKMTNSFWFQNKWFNNFIYTCMLPIWNYFKITDPRRLYCKYLSILIFLINDKFILFNKELNELIHAAWIQEKYVINYIVAKYAKEELELTISKYELFYEYLTSIHIDDNILLKNKKKINKLI